MPVPNAREILDMEFKGQPNVMTPEVVKIGKLHPQIAYEVSVGVGMDGRPIYGVSLVRWDWSGKTVRLREHSKCVESRKAANEYLDELRNNVADLLVWRDE